MYGTTQPTISDLKAGVAFYGSLIDKSDAAPKSSIDLAAEVKPPVLGLYGADDAGIKLDQIKDMEEALKAAKKTFEFIVYSGAPHGFVADYRPSYRKDAAEDALAAHARLVQKVWRAQLNYRSKNRRGAFQRRAFSCLAKAMPAFICVTCGTQFAPSPKKPARCPICDEPRQFVPPSGQAWTTHESLSRRHIN